MNTCESGDEPLGEAPELSGVERLLQGADLVAAKVLLAEEYAARLERVAATHVKGAGEFCEAGCYGDYPCATRRILDGGL